MTALDGAEKPVGCVSWRATQQCSPFGVREPSGDADCRATVQFTSGYCECENSAVVALVYCGMHSFTCFDRCRELGSSARRLPRPMTCPAAPPQRQLAEGSLSLSGNSTRASGGSDSSASFGGSGSSSSTLRAAAGAHAAGVGNASAAALAAGAAAAAGSGGATTTTAAGAPEERLPDHSAELWESLVVTVRSHDPKPPSLLPKRTEDDDWLREGGAMPAGLAPRLHRALHDYIDALAQPDVPGGTTPPPTQHGRGIVMVSGGLRYMVSAWISIAMLRRTGSTLPVEMWFPVLEYPTSAVVAALAARGVRCRAFAVADLDQAGYALKVAAIMLSDFAEVLFLDADNFPLADPAGLFEAPEYLNAGCIFWRDYWDPTAVPGLAEILGVPRREMPAATFEAGQMLIDKRRHWRGMRVALYFNYYSEVWYNLFTDYMGWGDKETFYYAFLAAREPAYYVPTPTGSIGMVRPFCRRFKSRQLCREVFTGNSMVQYGLAGAQVRDPDQEQEAQQTQQAQAHRRQLRPGAPDGEASQPAQRPGPLFLHANLEKWSLRLPDSWADYVRRWRVLQPGAQDFPDWSQRVLGLDLERYVFEQVRSFRCAPFFAEYYEVRRRHGDKPIPPLAGLHTLQPGIEFHQMYRLGHRGTYTQLFERSALDTFLFELGAASRTALPPLKRALRRYVWGGRHLARLLFKLERKFRNALLASAT